MAPATWKAIRRVYTAVDAPQLTRFSLRPPKSVEVEFADGHAFNLSAEYLRVHSPAADSKIRSFGGEKVIFGRSHVGIMSAEPIGNYGVRLVFDDLHKTGIYTWEITSKLYGDTDSPEIHLENDCWENRLAEERTSLTNEGIVVVVVGHLLIGMQ
ncbi:hypothetical protein V2J09_019833 [Rumex salicifolius]